jgi:cellulase (glycosyl hydrolase family 5)
VNVVRGRSSPRSLAPALLATVLAAAVILAPGMAGAATVRYERGLRSASPPDHIHHPHKKAASVTYLTAHDGKFWLGGTWKVLHGMKESADTNNVESVTADIARDAAWGFNLIRLHVHWTELEPTAPVKNGSIWTHTYDANYITAIKLDLAAVASNGMYAIVTNDGDQGASYFSFPEWLYTAPYNSHGTTYAKTNSGLLSAQTNFWTDSLQQQFMSDFLKYLAAQLAGTSGVAGYEILNEPQAGSLPTTLATTQLIVNWQLTAGKAIRAIDPNRILFFTTHEGYAPGVSDPGLDLTNWVTAPPGNPNGLTQPMGSPDVAFVAHDYFGARWGTGLQRQPGSSDFQENYQVLYDNTLANPEPPYIGTTLGQLRWIQDKSASLASKKIPLIVDEVGDQYTDPNAGLFFGTAMAALNHDWTAWSVSGTNNGVVDTNGNLRSYGQIVIDAANSYP